MILPQVFSGQILHEYTNKLTTKEENSFGTRLKFILDELQYSGNAFAQTIGVGGSLVHKTLRGQNLPSVKFCMAIHKHFPEINWDYMITGRGAAFLAPGKIKRGLDSSAERPSYDPTDERPPQAAEGKPVYQEEMVTQDELKALENRMHEKMAHFTTTTLEMIKELLAAQEASGRSPAPAPKK